MFGNRETACRSACCQRVRIFDKSGSFSRNRRCRVMSSSSAAYTSKSIGGPTVTFDFIVESRDNSAYFAASSNVVC